MGHSFQFRPSPRHLTVQKCSMCEWPIGEKSDPEEITSVNLCGAEKYVVCLICDRVVSEAQCTAAYKDAWDRENQKRLVERQSRSDDSAEADVPESTTGENSRHKMTPDEWIRDREAFEARIKKKDSAD